MHELWILIATVLYLLQSLKCHIFHFVIFSVTSDFLWLVDSGGVTMAVFTKNTLSLSLGFWVFFVSAYVICMGWDAVLIKSFCFL